MPTLLVLFVCAGLWAGLPRASVAASPPAKPGQPSDHASSCLPCGSFGAWSTPVDDIRGRLVATPVGVAGEPRQLRLDLQLENVSNRAEPIVLVWGDISEALQLVLEDEPGTPLPAAPIGGNYLASGPEVLTIPVHSQLQMQISPAAYDILPRGTKLLRLFSLRAWDISALGKQRLYLRGVVKPRPAKLPPPTGQYPRWVGPLTLPRVALPVDPP